MDHLQEIIDAINAEGTQLTNDPRFPAPMVTWRIKVDGKFITTATRKTVWKQIGHAKSALRLHFETLRYKMHDKLKGDLKHRTINELFEEAYQKFLTTRVKFVKITSEDTVECGS